MRSLVLGGVVLAVSAAGCSLFVSDDGYAGGAGGSADSGTSERDREGGSDTGLPAEDGGLRDADNGSDASDASDVDAGEPTPSCPPPLIVCDDFERATAAGQGWTGVDAPVLSTKQSSSPTRSLLVEATGTASPRLRRIFLDPPAYIRVAFKMFVGAATLDRVEILKTSFGSLNQWDTAVLTVTPSGIIGALHRYEGAPSTAERAELPLATATVFGSGWHAIELEVDMRAPTKVLRGRLDTAAKSQVTLPGKATPQKPMDVQLGVGYRLNDVPMPAWYIDDFSITPL